MRVRDQLSQSFKQQHDFIVADFNNSNDLRLKIQLHLRDFRSPHILINNTGGPPSGTITEAKTEEFLSAFNNHLICNHILAQAVLPGMKESKYGRIVNIISTSVKQPLKNLGVSNTIRSAVANWSKTLATEVAPFGITVNNVLPGATNTARIQNILESRMQKTGKSLDELRKEMMMEVPMQRLAETSDIANAAAFLCTPAAGYITGINLPVDGGRTGCL
jgi:3-oxoacyl-[acyl-carrier protein] reductase